MLASSRIYLGLTPNYNLGSRVSYQTFQVLFKPTLKPNKVIDLFPEKVARSKRKARGKQMLVLQMM